jgi:hypothetical protein
MRKPSKARLAREAKFKAEIEKYLIARGATYSPRFRDWHIESAAGPLRVHVDTDGDLYTMFCRFEDVVRANEDVGYLADLNPYSGKYNFHMTAPTDNDGLDYTIKQAWVHLSRAL